MHTKPNPLFQIHFGHFKTSCCGKITYSHCAIVGHENQDCEAPFHCVNCKQDHPSYSKNCEKWKIEKEIQTVRTKQNLSYPEARKIVESRTPIVGTSYAAKTVLNLNKKTYRTIETQTELPAQCISESSKATKENLQIPPKPSRTSKASQSNASKLPLHKRSKETKTDFRSSMSPETLESVLIAKSHISGPCYAQSYDADFLKKAKSATTVTLNKNA